MDAEQRRRAGEAVARAMDEQGLTTAQLAEMSQVAPVTIRDLTSGKRWPWTSKRNAIEFALEWDAGTIAQIAKGHLSATGEVDPAELLEGHEVDEALEVLLRHSPLTRARRTRVMACYLAELEEQQRLEGTTPPRRASEV